MKKLLEQHTIGPSRVWLESDFYVNVQGYLVRRYRVCYDCTHVVRSVEWTGSNDIDAAHAAYVVAIEARQDAHAAEIEARKLAAKLRGGCNAGKEGFGKLLQHYRRGRGSHRWADNARRAKT